MSFPTVSVPSPIRINLFEVAIIEPMAIYRRTRQGSPVVHQLTMVDGRSWLVIIHMPSLVTRVFEIVENFPAPWLPPLGAGNVFLITKTVVSDCWHTALVRTTQVAQLRDRSYGTAIILRLAYPNTHPGLAVCDQASTLSPYLEGRY